jgi:hypothetical protein
MLDSDLERFAVATLTMFKNFRTPPDKDVTKILFLGLKHLSIEDAENVITLAIMHEERFPSLGVVKKYISVIPPKNTPRIAYTGHSNQKLADDSMRLINGHLDDKLTREHLIEGMMVMEKQYPGIGWREEASSLVNYYRIADDDRKQVSAGR